MLANGSASLFLLLSSESFPCTSIHVLIQDNTNEYSFYVLTTESIVF